MATDLLGRTLDAVETPTPLSAQGPALGLLADGARRYLRRWQRRRPLWVGVAIGGVVDGTTGHVDHPRLGWRQAPVARCWPKRWACRCRWRLTSTRWPVPSCCLGCAASRPTRRPACTSTPARPWDTRW
ncbi:rOK family protein [Mycobacterium xenopi 3993]|nr:rOK family protein [Mycobacterium xenopi 3993]